MPINNGLLVQPNNTQQRIFSSHTLSLPSCCPISGNPQPGSTITIRYRAEKDFLEVISLAIYIASFVGGRDGIRDMEGMIAQIAQDCADTVGVFVRVDAVVILQDESTMRIVCKATP